MRANFRRTAIALATAAMMLSTAPLQVSATSLSNPRGQAAVTAATMAVNPWGCYVRADNPHISSHYPDRVSGQAHQLCPGSGAPNMTIEGWLKWKWCFFFYCEWRQLDYKVASMSRLNDLWVAPSFGCKNKNDTPYRLEAKGTVQDSDYGAPKYYGYDAKEITVAGCGQ